jgi:ATP-dependent Clp protease ATP-binding subunit ClpC
MTTYAFNPAAREALHLSRLESARRNHAYIGTEHILLGLLALKTQTFEALTRRLRLDRASVASRVDGIIERGKGPTPALTDLPFTSRGKRVLELAIEAAGSVGTTDVGPDHLLLGLCAEQRGLAAQVLAESGISPEDVRKAIHDSRG